MPADGVAYGDAFEGSLQIGEGLEAIDLGSAEGRMNRPLTADLPNGSYGPKAGLKKLSRIVREPTIRPTLFYRPFHPLGLSYPGPQPGARHEDHRVQGLRRRQPAAAFRRAIFHLRETRHRIPQFSNRATAVAPLRNFRSGTAPLQ